MSDTHQGYFGSGVVELADLHPVTRAPLSFRDIGSVPTLNLNFTTEKFRLRDYRLPGRPVLDTASIPGDKTFSFTTTNLNAENIAMFFMSRVENVSLQAVTGQVENIGAILPGQKYYLGGNGADAAGVKNLTDVSITYEGEPLENLIDYVIEPRLGAITFLVGGAVISGGTAIVTYSADATTFKRVAAGDTTRKMAMRFNGNNLAGENKNVFIPMLDVTPDGDLSLINDDFAELQFSAEILKRDGMAQIYLDGMPLEI